MSAAVNTGAKKCDVILAGVGGQGVLALAAIITKAAVAEGLTVRQSEVHGMAQRGGAVLAHLRIADGEIASDLVPRGAADLVLSMEPLESLRYIGWLGKDSALVTAAEPFVNIPNYPDVETVHASVKAVPGSQLIAAKELAQEAGSARSVNMVLVGAASHYLPVSPAAMQAAIAQMFADKGEKILDANKIAFDLGRNAGASGV